MGKKVFEQKNIPAKLTIATSEIGEKGVCLVKIGNSVKKIILD
jgi:hypothetical protein